jgi:hypothetical protein
MKIHLCFFLLFSILFTSTGFSQKASYRIINRNKTTNISEYKDALDNANFNRIRYKSKRRQITFLNGPTIELLSAQELISKGVLIDLSEAINDGNYIDDSNTWKLAPNGHIIHTISMNNKINYKK